jgi:hypothetical protein
MMLDAKPKLFLDPKKVPLEVDPKLWMDICDLEAVFTKRHGSPIGIGCNRMVFSFDDDTVIKIPINSQGFFDNYREAVVWETAQFPYPCAKSRLIHDKDYPDVVLLSMEKVEPVQTPLRELPSWVYSVDCGQVGYTKDRELVAYDYA